MTANKPTEVVRIEYAAAILQVTPRTVYRMIESGDLEAVDTARPGSQRTRLRVKASSLRKYQEEQEQFIEVT